ncbi:MAG: NADH-quinone oxidoreductase subunit A [Chloroflexi bacterium]|nr:NADH-quinone oxidoreductase subunit A [Chloroflexota bacterium]
MLASYGHIGLLILLAILFPASTLVISYLLSYVRVRPKKPNPIKAMTYECGMDTRGPAWVQFNFRYYFFALLFLVFAIETIFLYPWAVAYSALGWFGLGEMMIFIAILLVGYVYAWKKKTLEWK